MESFNAEDLRDWQKSEKGKPFWNAIERRFADGVSKMRVAVRKGDLNEAMYHCSQIDAAEEVLQLVTGLIEEKKQEKMDEYAEADAGEE